MRQQPSSRWHLKKFAAQQNIAHFEALLKSEPELSERRILESMPREDRAKLAAAEAPPRAAKLQRATQDVDPVPC